MTSNTQNYPLAVALLNYKRKQYRKLILEDIDETKEILEKLNEKMEKMLEEHDKLYKKCLKAEIKFLTYIFNKNKEESFKGYKKCQELANSLLEYCMSSSKMAEGETLVVANMCKVYHETKKNCFKVAIKLDNEIGYWK